MPKFTVSFTIGSSSYHWERNLGISQKTRDFIKKCTDKSYLFDEIKRQKKEFCNRPINLSNNGKNIEKIKICFRDMGNKLFRLRKNNPFSREKTYEENHIEENNEQTIDTFNNIENNQGTAIADGLLEELRSGQTPHSILLIPPKKRLPKVPEDSSVSIENILKHPPKKTLPTPPDNLSHSNRELIYNSNSDGAEKVTSDSELLNKYGANRIDTKKLRRLEDGIINEHGRVNYKTIDEITRLIRVYVGE